METALKWLLSSATSGWEGISVIMTWANDNVLAAIFFGYLLRETAGYIVKKTPTKYDDIGLEIIEDAFRKAWSKVTLAKGKK